MGSLASANYRDWRSMMFNAKRAKSAIFGISLLALSVPQLSVISSAQQISTALGSSRKIDNNKSNFAADGSGTLLAMATSGKSLGQCPLQHTDVKATISGYMARVSVKQVFHNSFSEKIEATYTFPLSDSGAVDNMVMKVGERTIKGVIKKREEAKEIYEAAKARGNVASLLNQERTNIFTQSVANIEPGQTVEITLNYVELMPYESGQFTFAFPTVVGPRFNPGSPTGHQGTGWAHDTTEVPDASRITPPVTPEGTRAGHDISISVNVDAGMPIQQISSKLHEVQVERHGSQRAEVSLKDKATIPNKDFVLTWNVAGSKLQSGYLTYRDAKIDKSGYFTLMMMPPKQVTPDKVAPKEMIFLIDCSGSQRGKPLDKAKETMNYILDRMNPDDTFQIIAFSSGQRLLFDKPQQVSDRMKHEAHEFIASLAANGGTWMAPAVEKACEIEPDDHRLRIVTFMTDGFVGNDYEIIGMIKKLRNKSRWFSFGTGNSVNRNLIDNIAHEGGGEPDYVLLNSTAEEVGSKFYKRISSPVLTDVKVDFGSLDVKEVYPREVGDVWAERPLYFKGRYATAGVGTITISGFAAGKPYKQTMQVDFPERNAANDAIASIWARAKVDRLMSEDWFAAQGGHPDKEIKDEIVKTALDHHIMTQYTSFVAVEETKVTKGGAPVEKVVPVEMPDGVSREGVFGGPRLMQPNAVGARQSWGGGGAGRGMQMYVQKARLSTRGDKAFQPQGGNFTNGVMGKAEPNNNFRAQPLPVPPIAIDAAGSPVPSSSAAPQSFDDRTAIRSSGHSESIPRGTLFKKDEADKKEEAEKHASKSTESKQKESQPEAKPSESKLSDSLRKLCEGSLPTTERRLLEISNSCVTIKINCEPGSKEVLRQLAKLGFVLIRHDKSGGFVGKIEISKLIDLSKQTFVHSIEPAKE